VSGVRLVLLRIREFFAAFQRKHVIRLLLIVGFVAGVALVVGQFAGGNPRQLDNVFGVVETAASHGRLHGGDTYMTVTLDDGDKIIVELPKGQLVIAGARVELETRARDTATGTWHRYKFVRYLDKTAEPRN
jgi:hypothetical protein